MPKLAVEKMWKSCANLVCKTVKKFSQADKLNNKFIVQSCKSDQTVTKFRQNIQMFFHSLNKFFTSVISNLFHIFHIAYYDDYYILIKEGQK